MKDLFGEIEGMVSWRLSIQKDGVSRGFGFAEFKTPEGTARHPKEGVWNTQNIFSLSLYIYIIIIIIIIIISYY